MNTVLLLLVLAAAPPGAAADDADDFAPLDRATTAQAGGPKPGQSGADVVVPLDRLHWIAQPSWLPNPAAAGDCTVVRRQAGSTQPGPAQPGASQRAFTQFRVAAPTHGMKWNAALPTPFDPGKHAWLVMRCRAERLSAQGEYTLCVMGRKHSGQEAYTAAIVPRQVADDGAWHLVEADLRPIAKQYREINMLAVQVQADGEPATLDIESIRLTDALPPAALADAVRWQRETGAAGAAKGDFRTLPLPEAGRVGVAPWKRHLRLDGWFDAPQVIAEDVPFALAPTFDVLAGRIATRGQLRIPCSTAASEAYLLVAAALEGEDEPAYGGGPFRAIRDVDRFRIRLEYTDGSADECLPMNVASRRFEIIRGLQVVVAAADPAKTLRAVVLVDDCRQASFAVAGATLWTSPTRRLPAALDVPPAYPTRTPKPSAAAAQMKATAEFAAGPKCLRHWRIEPGGWDLIARPTPLVAVTVDGRELPDNSLVPERSNSPSVYTIRGLPGVRLELTVRDEGLAGLHIAARLVNAGTAPRRVGLIAPRFGPYRLSADAGAAWYWFPKRGTALDQRPGSYRERYSGLFPVQFVDTFDPSAGRGLALRTLDRECLEKYYRLDKKADGLTLAVEYPERSLRPGESLTAAPAVLWPTDGDPRRGFEAYREWLAGWHRPISPRKAWFREVFNFRQRFLWWLDPLYDQASGKIDLARAVDEARREFGGIDYLHLFDWGNCGQYGRIYGRTGDYSPYDYLRGGREALHATIAGVRRGGVPVGLYIEGYLLSEAGKLGKGPGKAWQMIAPDGTRRYWPDSNEMYVCSFVPEWRSVQASTYQTKVRELDVDGMYLDEYGFAGTDHDCWSPAHGHAVPGYVTLGERDATEQVRRSIDAAKPGVALYTEETPVDVTTQLQDGSFTYAMAIAASTNTRVPLNTARFAFPDFKTIEILYCDKPTGSWATGVKRVFFNGEAIWLEGPAAEWFEPQTREAIRRCYAVLREHRDAFTTLRPQPLVPTAMPGVYANAFPIEGKTVYTLYNTRRRTVRGDVLALAADRSVAWHDALRNQPADVRHEAGRAIVRLEIGPEDVGCLVAQAAVRRVIDAPPPSKPIEQAVMQRIYDEVKTPFKFGIVLRGEGDNAVDCPCVFRHDGRWCMLYVTMNKVGYETLLAESDDLVNWRKRGAVLPFRKTGWDAWQAGGFVALQDTAWGGSYTLEKFEGRYWGTYVGGALQGYETDPLSMGAMTTTDPARSAPWERLPQPILAPNQSDARRFETLTLYKSNVIRDPKQSLGWPFVMFYNAKAVSGYERIGMAVSRDMRTWHRFGRAPVIDNGSGISGDPQIVRIGDLWVMFYFGAFWKPDAFDTFACSRDLVTWTKWTGPHLIAPSEPWDKQYAHKPWLVKHSGVVYHYYCAVGDRGRVIALATSKDLKSLQLPNPKHP